MLSHLPAPSVLLKGGALLERPGLLKKRFLRMEGDGAPSAILGCYTPGP
jgi:hypothetical protein